jgi:hypothetical protein
MYMIHATAHTVRAASMTGGLGSRVAKVCLGQGCTCLGNAGAQAIRSVCHCLYVVVGLTDRVDLRQVALRDLARDRVDQLVIELLDDRGARDLAIQPAAKPGGEDLMAELSAHPVGKEITAAFLELFQASAFHRGERGGHRVAGATARGEADLSDGRGDEVGRDVLVHLRALRERRCVRLEGGVVAHAGRLIGNDEVLHVLSSACMQRCVREHTGGYDSDVHEGRVHVNGG